MAQPVQDNSTVAQAGTLKENITLSELPPDLLGNIFNKFIDDLKLFTMLCCVDKRINKSVTHFWAGRDLNLKQICPELTIIDAKAQGKECGDEPKFNQFEVWKWVKKLAPHIEDKAGLTLLTMTKGTTLSQLAAIAAKDGKTVKLVWPAANQIDHPIDTSYRILISNSVFMKSSGKYENSENRLLEHGCEMPTAVEYVALGIYTSKIFKGCLSLVGRKPTSAHARNRIDKYSLLVKSIGNDNLYILRGDTFNHYGAAGRRKF